MGLLKKLENAGRSVGKAVRQASPFVSFIPGIGPVAAGALGSLGSLAEGRNMKGHLKAGAIGAISGLGIDKLQATGKLGSVLSGGMGRVPIPGKGLPMPDLSALDAMNGGAPGGGGGGRIASLLGGIGKFLPKNGQGGIDLGMLAKLGLGGLGAYQASKAAGKADEYRKKGLASVEAEYAAGAGLRKMGMEGMMDPRMADVSGIFNQPRPNYRRV